MLDDRNLLIDQLKLIHVVFKPSKQGHRKEGTKPNFLVVATDDHQDIPLVSCLGAYALTLGKLGTCFSSWLTKTQMITLSALICSFIPWGQQGRNFTENYPGTPDVCLDAHGRIDKWVV